MKIHVTCGSGVIGNYIADELLRHKRVVAGAASLLSYRKAKKLLGCEPKHAVYDILFS
ncbi:MAG: hypothetical protein WBW71_06550 [Bacteroidota bacterium]